MKIKVSLGNIGKAIKQVEAYQKSLDDKKTRFLERMVEEGVKIAKAEAPFDFGDLYGSIHGHIEDSRGFVVCDAMTADGFPYAVAVEFGFGPRGVGTAPHTGISVTYTPSKADSNKQKAWVNDTTWWYYDEKRGKYRLSSGQPANPFMYRTAQALRPIAKQLAREIFGGK